MPDTKPVDFNDAKNVEELVTQAVGAGSACWHEPDEDGDRIFDDVSAVLVVDAALERLKQLSPGVDVNQERGIDNDPEFFHGLTMWGEAASFQIRSDQGERLVVFIREDAPRSSENGHPACLPASDARRLRDLLNVATARGYL